MKTETTIVRVKYGRQVEIRPQVLVWRKRMTRYREMKAEIATWLGAKRWSREELNQWLTSPAIGLNHRSPKQLMNPRSIAVLHEWARKVLT